MKRIIVLIPVILLFITSQSNAQYTVVRINTIPVYGEEWASLNPKNPNQIVAATHTGYGNHPSNMGYFYSTNGGLNWSGDTLFSNVGQPGTDPVVVCDTAGNFYYICIGNWGNPPPNLDRLLCVKSTDGGASWNGGTAFALLAPKFDDMPMACVDFSHSQYGNSLYVTWTLYDSLFSSNPEDSSYVYISRSSDGGATFSNPVRVSKIAGSSPSNNSAPEGPVPSTGINGDVYVCYSHNQQVLFNRSTNGGANWLSSEIVASEQVGGWTPMHSPVIDCDHSNSPYRGNVYIVFSDLRNGINDRDIWLVKSTNNGNNWSGPVRVNNDSPNHLQQLPWICVDRVTGYVWIAFYDSRNYSNSLKLDMYVARSTDGGSTFQNVKVSDAGSALINLNWVGEYIGLTAYNNRVRPVWATSTAFGNAYLWTAIIDTFVIGIQPISGAVPVAFSLGQNYPNPFNPTTKIRFDLPKSNFTLSEAKGLITKLVVYNVLGEEVAVLVNQQLNPGLYEVDFPANGEGSNYSSGVYYYRLTTGDYSETKKMVLIK